MESTESGPTVRNNTLCHQLQWTIFCLYFTWIVSHILYHLITSYSFVLFLLIPDTILFWFSCLLSSRLSSVTCPLNILSLPEICPCPSCHPFYTLAWSHPLSQLQGPSRAEDFQIYTLLSCLFLSSKTDSQQPIKCFLLDVHSWNGGFIS